ncbi:MOSC domain-containing protein [Brevibacillus ginsengisoli]|uniref:MOSC domain-containing protein n=1 Tax=Brevibacillus ginsengisoli TaxID=363854 RepID=UPI003CF62204
MSIQIVTLSIGLPQTMVYGENATMMTGICKEQVQEAYLAVDCFRGDGVHNTKYHGGPDRAVCVYPHEHYAMWEQELQTKLPPAALGENLTVTNMREDQVHIGDIYRIGEALVQVTQGRIPCNTISRRNSRDQFLPRIVETGYTGYFFRVLEEGMIRSDSPIQLVQRDPHEVTVLFANQVLFHDNKNHAAIDRILAVDALAEVWRTKLNKLLEPKV